MTLYCRQLLVVAAVATTLMSNGQVQALQFVASTREQLSWALTMVKAGDVILLPVVDIEMSLGEPFRSFANGTVDNPITIRGLGPESIIRHHSSAIHADRIFMLEHSHWVFDNLRFAGNYNEALFVDTLVEGVIVTNVTFGSVDSASQYGIVGIAIKAKSMLIDNCDFKVGRFGIEQNTYSGDDTHIQVTNCRFDATGRERAPLALILSGTTFSVENNYFTSTNASYWDTFVRLSSAVTGHFTNNTGHMVTSGGFTIYSYHEVGQVEYVFDGNHCDIQFDYWCIYVSAEGLFNKTLILDNNTYENGRGLTNKPMNASNNDNAI